MKKILVVILIAVFAIGSVIGYSFYRNYSLNESYKRVKIGDSESRVLLLMGKPSKVVLLGQKEFWSSNVEGSVKELHYQARILPEIWIIGLDSTGKTVYRNHNIM